MNRISQRLLGWAGGAAALAVILGATTASATTLGPNDCLNDSSTGRVSTGSICYIQLDIVNTPNPSYTYAASGYIWGSIQTTSDTHTLLVTFDANTINGVTWDLGDLFLNIIDPGHATVSNISFIDATPGSHAPTFSLSTVHIAAAPVTATNPSGGFQADGWGQFDFELADHSGTPYAASHLSFDVKWSDQTWTDTTPSGTTGRLLSQAVLVLNGNGNQHGQNDGGQSAAGHVYNSAGFTGYAAWPAPSDVPEPGSLAILASGLAGLGFLRRRRRLAQS